MGTEILKSFGTLQSELEQAKTSLKGVDENIKRLIGRDPSELPPRSIIKRGPPGEDRNRPRINRSRNFGHENDEPPVKRRNSGVSVFKRLSDRPSNHYDDDTHIQPQKGMISKVIVTPKELPSRQEALAAQSRDEKSKARNRRMFGALLGTLQKFQQEETKLKQKEEKRAQLERKIEEHEIKEKEEIKKERQELFFNRKKKQAEIKMIELKMTRMKEYSGWEERQKPRMNFIYTKAKPHIHYLPRKMTEASKALLETCKQDIEKMIDKKRQEVFDELQHIEDRMKKNFEGKKFKDPKEEDADNQEETERNEDDEEDDTHTERTSENPEEKQEETIINDSNIEKTPENSSEDKTNAVPDNVEESAEQQLSEDVQNEEKGVNNSFEKEESNDGEVIEEKEKQNDIATDESTTVKEPDECKMEVDSHECL